MEKLIEHLKGKDIWWGLLTFTILGAVIFFGVMAYRTGKTLDNVAIVLTCLTGLLMQLVQYRYGSSKGSKDKQEQLDKRDASTPGA